MLFKKIACFLLALVTAAQPMVASAADLDSAFSNLMGTGGAVSINSPGRFQSAARGGFSAGGLEMRVPRGNSVPQLLTASAPRISAGCNGISAHFGGFSFISGQEFANLLKQIASGAALGFVSSLVMKTLCPACEAVVQELKTAAQKAAELAKNSCELGKQWGEKFASSISSSVDMPSVCSTTSADNGGSSDTLSAYGSACKTLQSAYSSLKDFNSGANTTTPEGKKQTEALECPIGAGNKTWRLLTGLDEKGGLGGLSEEANLRKLLVINLLGAEMEYSGSYTVGCDTGAGGAWEASEEQAMGKNKNFCTPPADMRMYTGLFLCGAAPATLDGLSPAAKRYCQDYWGAAGPAQPLQLWTCTAGKGSTQEDFRNCPYLMRTDASNVVRGQGFFIRINKLLLSAVERVRTGVGYEDAEGQQIIALIQIAPYPLFQAINAAAVYPGAATELLDTMSVLVAEQYTHAVLDEMLRMEGRSSGGTCMTQTQATRVLDFISHLRTQNQSRLQMIGQHMAVQDGLTEQIRQINLTIQKQVMSEDLLATGKLSESLNRALTPTNAGASAPITTPSTP